MYNIKLTDENDTEEPPLISTERTVPLVFDLEKTLHNIGHWLPIQGPIKDFVHHNTLHAFQHATFHNGIALAAKIFGSRSYLPLVDYQNRFLDGRITDKAIDWALTQTGFSKQQQTALKKELFEPDSTSHYPPMSLANQGIRNTWLNELELELNTAVHPILFRLLANFLDQGISRWAMPKANESFWDCVVRLSQNSLIPLYPFYQSQVKDLLNNSPEVVIDNCLAKIVGSVELYEQYLLEMLLAHPGWSGIVQFVEHNPNSLLACRSISLKEMIAVELICELALLTLKRGSDFPKVNHINFPAKTPLLNQPSQPIIPLPLKIWHDAMEWSLYSEFFLAIQTKPSTHLTKTVTPHTQALFCLDDRECSLRRYLEEIEPGIETFGAAGFFGIDFLYQGIDDAYPVAQCPVIIKPKHLIKESVSQENSTPNRKNKRLANIHFGSHSIFRGWLYSQTLGLSYAARMAWDVFKPGAKLPSITELSQIDAHSKLHLLRDTDQLTDGGYLLGFSINEMADKVESLLNNIGLNENFAPLVLVIAHGSSSANNPHFAAYDCGACAGKPGAPNARAFAWMANNSEVRAVLRERQIIIPDETFFVAALHNTSRDEVRYFDEHDLAQPVIKQLTSFKSTMDKALAMNAKERCRWFELAPKTSSQTKALGHVAARASSIFEPRPELNHSNNLYAVIGRRQLTRDLFMDRRAFLHSYNPVNDISGVILARILSAVIPVCGGINLEYLFSKIDNSVYGAGTKLPHNVIGLLGVANGVEGDLRTGLPSQMIEVHEPARLLIVVEQRMSILTQALDKLDTDLKQWLDNEWVRLAACDPDSHTLSFYTNGNWEPISQLDGEVPRATSSAQLIDGQNKTIPVSHLLRTA